MNFVVSGVQHSENRQKSILDSRKEIYICRTGRKGKFYFPYLLIYILKKYTSIEFIFEVCSVGRNFKVEICTNGSLGQNSVCLFKSKIGILPDFQRCSRVSKNLYWNTHRYPNQGKVFRNLTISHEIPQDFEKVQMKP